MAERPKKETYELDLNIRLEKQTLDYFIRRLRITLIDYGFDHMSSPNFECAPCFIRETTW